MTVRNEGKMERITQMESDGGSCDQSGKQNKATQLITGLQLVWQHFKEDEIFCKSRA